MPARRPSPRRWAAPLAIAALGLACAVVVSDSGPNQAAHFALVRSLASGTAEIDPRETIDAAYVDGRYYAAKAPGLAMFTLPWYLTLRAAGLQDDSAAAVEDNRHRVWALGLFGSVLPMLVLLLLTYLAADRVAPGYGLPTAVLLGAGTLLLPFATLFFDHMLSAALGFGAFVVLLFERASVGRRWRLAAAGVLAGLAIVVEFPLGIVALVLAGYAAAAAAPVRRVATYGSGLLLGVLPLLAYNWWAFGSPARLSYTNALEAPAGSGAAPVVGANDEGFYGVGLPDPRAALSVLFSEKGLAVVAPLAIVALAGLPLLWRAGRRAEAAVCGAVSLLFVGYNAAYYLPFGGQGPGPRFLVPALPFLALPLALALKARPVTVVALGLGSMLVMALATVTDPLTGAEHGIGAWLGELHASRLTETVVGDGWPALILFAALLVGAVGIAVAFLPLRRSSRSDVALACGAVLCWLALAASTPDLLPSDAGAGTTEGTLAVVALALAIAVSLWLTSRYGPTALLAVLPILLLAAPGLESRPRLSLLLAGVGLLGVTVALWVFHRPAEGEDAAAGATELVSADPITGPTLISGEGSPTG